MANLLRFLVDLATDEHSRVRFRADPAEALAPFATATPGGVTGEDVTAAARVARHRLGWSVDAPATDDDFPAGEPPADAATRQLLTWCAAAEAAAEPDGASAAVAEASASSGPEPSRPGTWTPDEEAAVIELARRAEELGEAVDPDPGPATDGRELPSAPPGLERHLWAIAGDRDTAYGDPDHPAPADGRPLPPLSSVPEPPGGFRFSILELVVLPEGIPEADIEPGAEATVVAVHHEPELSYEVEVSDEDGGRRFLGVVPHHAVARP